MVFAVNDKLSPIQRGPLFPATGAAGIPLMVAVVFPAALVHPFSVAYTEYVPEAAVVAARTAGFCSAEEKPAGPFQEYVELPTVLEVRLRSDPEQIGELLPATGAAGVGFTVTDTVPAALEGHPGTVAVTE